MLQHGSNKDVEGDQRVSVYVGGSLARGTVRYIAKEKDSSGKVRTVLGLEMVWYGFNLFTCTVQSQSLVFF